ncbi:ribonuclease H-like domain-containing protein [Candidatus Woesearchaeota archaeon]|nr:ribonuclease H-like domain-containing protein [Candidatus Woesearchaeota archaeon]
MIRQSFCFLPRTGLEKEKKVWRQDIHDWNTFLETKNIKGFSTKTKQTADEILKTARQKLFEEDAAWFAQKLKSSEHWRLYNTFKDETVYLDIETDGYYGSITVVGLYDGQQTKTFVRGINLDRKLLADELAKYKMIVTFNGASFDLPVIRRYFNIVHSVPHVDLRFVCQKAGLTGGLKQIEQTLGIKRADEVYGMNGIDAVALWQLFKQTKEREHLERIIKYNEEDIINLPIIAHKIIPQLWQQIRNKTG